MSSCPLSQEGSLRPLVYTHPSSFLFSLHPWHFLSWGRGWTGSSLCPVQKAVVNLGEGFGVWGLKGLEYKATYPPSIHLLSGEKRSRPDAISSDMHPSWRYSLCLHEHVLSLFSCARLCDPMDRSPPGSSVHGDSPGKNTGGGCYALLQGIFPTQVLNPCLFTCPELADRSFYTSATWEACVYSLNIQH